MSTTQKERYEVTERLRTLGISYDDAQKLRRISLTLRRWFELECGDGNEYASWAIERDEHTDKPYLVKHFYSPHRLNDHARFPIADRETGARKRLAILLAKYPTLHAYVQTDPRDAALYLLTAEQVAWNGGTIEQLDSIYSRGIAVY